MLPPKYEDMIYNRHLIDQNNYKEVHIHDDIANTHFSNSNSSTGTWAGDLSICSKLDWSFLQGRDVRYIFDIKIKSSF